MDNTAGSKEGQRGSKRGGGGGRAGKPERKYHQWSGQKPRNAKDDVESGSRVSRTCPSRFDGYVEAVDRSSVQTKNRLQKTA